MDKMPRGQRSEGTFLAPFGLIRGKKVVIAPKIPEFCKVIKHFRYFDDARQGARKMKQKDPKGLYGYDFDPEKGAWAAFVCTQVPPGARFTQDGLIILPPSEQKFETY